MLAAARRTGGSGSGGAAAGWASWIDAELAGCALGDKRLCDRLRRLLHQFEGAMGAPLPLACQDWANTKAAYRFLSSERFGEDAILAGHFQATASRFAATAGLVLVVQDTTEFSFRWAKPETIGAIGRVPVGRDRNGNPRTYTQCGLLMHTSFVVTPEGLPLGLAAVQFWTRKEFKGTNALKRHVNPTRVPIEEKESIRWLSSLAQSSTLLGAPGRCVYLGDRENDIYEFFCAAREAGTHFLVRTCVDRLAGDGRRTVARVMARVPVVGQHRIEVTAENGNVSEAVLRLRYKRVHILPPIGKQKRYPALDLTVISPEEAVEKLQWYAQRWKVELFHRILKSGCRVEAARLRTAERLTKLIAVFCILSWRIFWTTMINRVAPDTPPRSALTEAEITVIDRAVRDRPTIPGEKTLAHYLTKVACLGGYLARARDPPPGNTVMWRGWSRLMDIMLGADLMQPNCG
jgi:hypothetical protein